MQENPNQWEFALGRIREAAARFSATNSLAGTPSRYILKGNRLVRSGDVLKPRFQAGGLTRGSPGSEVEVVLPVATEVIHISGRSIRLLRLMSAPDLTAKIALPKDPRMPSLWGEGRSFRREIRIWQEAARIDSPLVVRGPIDYDLKEEWFVEKLVERRPIGPGDKRDFLASALVPFYEATVTHRPLSRLPDVKRLFDDLREIAPGFPQPSPDDKLPFVLAHGDISGPNMFWSSAGYQLIDWEYGSVLPAAFDLARLCQHDPSLNAPILETIERLGRDRGCLPPKTQLALGALARTRELRAADDQWQAYVAFIEGMTHEQAAQRKLQNQRRVHEFVRALQP